MLECALSEEKGQLGKLVILSVGIADDVCLRSWWRTLCLNESRTWRSRVTVIDDHTIVVLRIMLVERRLLLYIVQVV